jgi:hypothetical protein
MRNKYTVRIAATLAMLVMVAAFGAASASAAPIVFCTMTADGTKISYSFPTDCSGSPGVFFPTGTTNHNIYVDFYGRCRSEFESQTELQITINGNPNHDYDYTSSNSLVPATNDATKMDVGYIQCNGSAGSATHRVSQVTFRIMDAVSTVNDKNVISTTADDQLVAFDWFGGSLHRTGGPSALNRIDIFNEIGAIFATNSVVTILED